MEKYREIVAKRLQHVEGIIEDYIPRILKREGIMTSKAELDAFFEREGEDSLSDMDLHKSGNTVLLGNAGAGKSYVLRNAYLQSAQAFLKDEKASIPVFVELRMDRGPKGDLEEAISLHHDDLLAESTKGDLPQVILFVDGLDEIWDMELRRFCNGMAKILNRFNSIISDTIISCRRARWESDYLKAWKASYKTYNVDYVSRATYKHIIKSEKELDSFYDEAFTKGVQPLLDVVFFGFDMAYRFANGEVLPRSRHRLLEARIENALKGTEKDTQSANTTSLKILANMLAILSTFTEKKEWETGEAFDSLTKADVFPSLGFLPTLEEVQTLFSRPVFIRSGSKFYFAHDLLREFLAGDALSHCTLRKQRQLFCSPMPGRLNRIPIFLRGPAIHLAEASDSFWRYLVDTEPLIAALAEPTTCSPDQKEILVKAVFEIALKERRSPWWDLTERGENLIDALKRWQPKNMVTFLKPYLGSQDDLARVLACQCADIWGGSEELNLDLAYIAMGEEEPETARVTAISAIRESGDKRAYRMIESLLSSSEDRVRGEALSTFKEIEKPSPALLLSKLEGGTTDRHSVGTLHMEARMWAKDLPADQLEEAFSLLEERMDKLGNLGRSVLQGLLDRALDFGIDTIPVQVVFRLCIERNNLLSSDKRKIKELLSKDRDFRIRVWKHSFEAIKYHKNYPYNTLSDYFAPYAEEFLDILPKTKEGLSDDQVMLTNHTLVWWLNKDSYNEKLLMLQNRAPAWKDLPLSRKKPPKAETRDILKEKEMIIAALKTTNGSTFDTTYNLLLTLTRILTKREEIYDFEDDSKKIVEYLKKHAGYIRQKVADTFEECVKSASYSCKKINANTIKRTPDWLAIPFYVLIELQRMLPLSKITEILRCFAFTDHKNSDKDRFLLETIKKEDEKLWENCLLGIIDDRCLGGIGAIEYLCEMKSPIYISRCRELLIGGDFRDYELYTLYHYWNALEPRDYLDVLWTCYLKMRHPISTEKTNWHQFQLLCTLVYRDDDFANWDLQERLLKEDLPVAREIGKPWWDGPLSTSPDMLSTLADWYALSRNRDQERFKLSENISNLLMSSIQEIGGQKATKELQRLVDENAFPGAEWLSYYIMQIEERILKDTMKPRSESEILNFIYKERAGLVESERDLFETIREAIEEVKESIELRGEGAAGLWNFDKSTDKREPKPEPECQNVLWPFLRTKLESYGISVQEESYIGPNKADLLIEKRDSGGDLYRTVFELKVARRNYGRRELIDSLETQLFEEYMIPKKCEFGIYTALWCKEKEYNFPTLWDTPDDLLKELQKRSEYIENKQRVSISCYVIDITTPYRKG